MQGLALSVVLHVAFLALWPEPAAPARTRAVMLYPDLIRPVHVEPVRAVPDPEPEGGSTAGAPAPPADAPNIPPTPSIAPPTDDGLTETAPPLATPRPVARAVAPRAPAFPPRTAPAAGVSGTGAAPIGDGAGGGQGAGAGSSPGAGAGAGDSDAGGPALVAQPDESPRLVTFPLPVNTPETERGDVRGRARVEVVVDERGRVVDARITERLRLGRGDREEAVANFPAAVDASVLEAARRLRFRPARLAGAPVRAVASVTLSVGV